MNGHLYYNKSNRNVVNKNIGTGLSVTLHYKENTDVVDPEILLSPDIDIKKYNYVHVAGNIDRYYYINDYEYSQQYCIIKCHVDVLKTYWDQFKNQEVIVRRQEDKNKCDLYLNDPEFTLENMDRIQLKAFKYGFTEYGAGKKASYLLHINGSGDGTTPPSNS
mgnify:FL=1